ncbi:MAG: zinc-binding dehydrogenase [Leptospiraceae bacterium]|nr:zinc-binding dehydrogenase [Leptospiraceae bacterium]
MSVPEKFRALFLKDYEGVKESFYVAEKPTELPKKGEVLIKIHSGVINPSDLAFVKGQYGIKKRLPKSGGFEGSGVVAAVGEGVSLKVGDRVACVSTGDDGTWSEYVLTGESSCIPLLDSVSLEAGSMLFVNPLTCFAMVNEVVKYGSPAFVQTAAASALGKMIIRLAKKKNIPVVNVVRREEQVEALKSMGEEHVLNSESPNFDKEFFKKTKKLNANFCLDAVGGDLTSKLFTLLPNKSKILSYGNLSEKNFEIVPGLLIFQDKKIEGFWLTYWLVATPREEFLKYTVEVQNLLDECFHSDVNKRFPLEAGIEALEFYGNNMTAGKVLFQPDLKP